MSHVTFDEPLPVRSIGCVQINRKTARQADTRIDRFLSTYMCSFQGTPIRKCMYTCLLALALGKLRRGFGRVERACRHIGLAEH